MLQLQSQIKLQQINEREHFGNETHKTQKGAIEAALAFVQDWVDSHIDEDEFRKNPDVDSNCVVAAIHSRK